MATTLLVQAGSAQTPRPDLRGTQVVGPLGRQIDGLLTRYAEYGLSGTVLVADANKIVLLKGYGFSNRTTREPNGPQTLFDWGSITKTVTGAAILKLEALGRLRTSDRVVKYVGQAESAKATATLTQLAQHTAGFARQGSPVSDSSRAGFMAKMRDAPAEDPPGTKYRYSNAGVSLLAAIVETVAQQPYERFAREQLFVPAGIEAGFRWEPVWDRGRARGYVGRAGEDAREPELIPMSWGVRGATGLIATVGQVYEWQRRLLQGDVLPPAQRARLLDSTTTEAFGWHYEPKAARGVAMIHKGGDFPGYATQIVVYPARDLVLIWALNDERQHWRDVLIDALSAAGLRDAPVVLPPPVAHTHRDSVERFVGAFSDSAGTSLDLRVAPDGYLYFASGNLARGVMFYPTGAGEFTAISQSGIDLQSLRFNRNAKEVTWSTRGRIVRLTR